MRKKSALLCLTPSMENHDLDESLIPPMPAGGEYSGEVSDTIELPDPSLESLEYHCDEARRAVVGLSAIRTAMANNINDRTAVAYSGYQIGIEAYCQRLGIDNLTVSNEGFNDQPQQAWDISLEGLGATLRKAVDALLARLARLFKAMVAKFSGLKDDVAEERKKISKLIKEIEELKSKKPPVVSAYTDELAAATNRSGTVDLLGAVENSSELTDMMFPTQAKVAASFADHYLAIAKTWIANPSLILNPPDTGIKYPPTIGALDGKGVSKFCQYPALSICYETDGHAHKVFVRNEGVSNNDSFVAPDTGSLRRACVVLESIYRRLDTHAGLIKGSVDSVEKYKKVNNDLFAAAGDDSDLVSALLNDSSFPLDVMFCYYTLPFNFNRELLVHLRELRQLVAACVKAYKE